MTAGQKFYVAFRTKFRISVFKEANRKETVYLNSSECTEVRESTVLIKF
jgi:hypothetical protein